ncbi:MAG: hypothetical protein FJ263_02045 [Planctomycetes bacterium]|nr:hypothetical protein [Planctomycetota bacterium]
MRKGYMLIEMILIISLLVVFLAVMTEPMRILLAEIPRGNQNFQTAASLNHLVNSLKMDVEAAKELKTGDDPNSLIITGNKGTTLYRFTEEQVCRIADDNPDPAIAWTLPQTHFVWDVKNPNALEITGWIEATISGRREKKFYNSHVFYTKGFEREQTQ